MENDAVTQVKNPNYTALYEACSECPSFSVQATVLYTIPGARIQHISFEIFLYAT